MTAGWGDPALLVAAGLVTSALLAPLAFSIDQYLLGLGVMTDDEPLVAPLQWPIGILEEWTHVVGPTLLISLLLGFPAWWSRQRTSKKVSDVPVVSEPATLTESCLQRLPPALGSDLIAARSELQYVRVYTTRGQFTV